MTIIFRRIISKGTFIPEIDGLRFIAIACVVLFHLKVYLSKKDLNLYDEEFSFHILDKILSHGHLGVPLFFVVSGFILSKPFAQTNLLNGDKVSLRSYFVRRITRLEPPYIIAMSGLFFGAVFIAKTVSLEDGVLSYLSSISYTHNFFYGQGTLPLLNAVAWSLEIEIQFYIIMPLFARIFLVNNNYLRRVIIIALILIFVIIDHFQNAPFISIINYMEYFLVGILLADFAVSNKSFKKNSVDSILTLLMFCFIWLVDMQESNSVGLNITLEVIQLVCIFLAYYLIIFHHSIKQLKNPIITGIGGMCYSIYLLHYPLISLVGSPLMAVKLSSNSVVNTLFHVVAILSFILIISAAYYLAIERPCMNRYWYKHLFNRKSKFIFKIKRV